MYLLGSLSIVSIVDNRAIMYLLGSLSIVSIVDNRAIYKVNVGFHTWTLLDVRQVLILDPCPLGLPEILIVAHVISPGPCTVVPWWVCSGLLAMAFGLKPQKGTGLRGSKHEVRA